MIWWSQRCHGLLQAEPWSFPLCGTMKSTEAAEEEQRMCCAVLGNEDGSFPPLQNLISEEVKRMDEDREYILGNYKGQASKKGDAKRKQGTQTK